MIYTVAIGDSYEIEANRLKRSLSVSDYDLSIFSKKSLLYKKITDDPLIDGLYHKSNFANYINKNDLNPIFFMDADMFTLKSNPLGSFKVDNSTDIALVPYRGGRWFFPDKIRQDAYDYFGYKLNSGFIYFKNLSVAKDFCNKWSYEYLEREKLYNIDMGTSKYEYDEYALMIALMKSDYKLELLDKKWNDWELNEIDEIKNSNSIFFQSHKHIDII